MKDKLFVKETMANASPPKSRKGNGTLQPKLPYTSSTIFFRLEQAYILQSTGIIDEDIAASLDPNHDDPLESPRPAKYRDVLLPPYWYSSSHSEAIEKKRKHMKRKGRLDFKTLSKIISENWRSAQMHDQSTVKYCEKLAEAELKKWNEYVRQETKQKAHKHVDQSKPVDGFLISPAESEKHWGEILRPTESEKYRGRSLQGTRQQLVEKLVRPFSDPRSMGTTKTQLEEEGGHLFNGGSNTGIQRGTCFSNRLSSQQADGLFLASTEMMSRLQNQYPNDSILPGYGYPPTVPVLSPLGGTHSSMSDNATQAARDFRLLSAQHTKRSTMIMAMGSSKKTPNLGNVAPSNENRHTSHFIPIAVTSSDVQDQHKRAIISNGAQEQHKQPEADNAICLFIPSDERVLDRVHNFPRCHCIQLCEKTKDDHTPGKVGQVGLRCFYCKKVCFPSKRDTIYDSVLNFQQNHLEICPSFPEKMKAKYMNLIQREYWSQKKRLSHECLKAYYAEAASEIGLVDSPQGLIFGAPQNKSGVPSERLQALIDSAEFREVVS